MKLSKDNKILFSLIFVIVIICLVIKWVSEYGLKIFGKVTGCGCGNKYNDKEKKILENFDNQTYDDNTDTGIENKKNISETSNRAIPTKTYQKVMDLSTNNRMNPVFDKVSVTKGEEKLNRIPKRIIQVWKTWSEKSPQMFSNYIESIKKVNPGYEYMFFKDNQINQFLEQNYPEYYDTFLKLPLNIQKVDFFRYIAIYHYGGFYFDLDVKGVQPLDNLLENRCVFPVDEIITKEMCKLERFKKFCDKDINFLLGQYAFGAAPGDPFIKLVIDKIHMNINNYIHYFIPNSDDYVYKTTGPDFITNVYSSYKNKDDIKILHYDKRQCFGKYATHDYVGTWKDTNI
jgi:mannosyltransferase OCH1-like enzyme